MRVIGFLMVFTMLFSQTSIYAGSATSEVDELLLSVGVPMAVLEYLPDVQKYEMFSSLQVDNVEDIAFESFTLTAYNVAECGEEFVQAGEFTIEAGDLFVPFHTIDSAHLSLTVVGFSGTANGQERFWIYPSFVWQVARNLRNDGFAMALFPGWEVIPGQRPNMRLWARDTRNDSLFDFSDHSPVSGSHAGHGFRFSTGSTMGGIFAFEGHASVTARKIGNPTRAISLTYVHDTASLFNTSFGFSIEPASISITGGGSSLQSMFRTFSF